MVGAVGDDGSNGVLDPIGDALRAQIVEQQHLGIERGTVGLAVGRIRAGIVARADAVQQSLVIPEQTLEALRHDLAYSGHCQVGFAGARIADQQQARPVLIGKIANEVFHRQQNVGQFAARDGILGTGHAEILERGITVKGRDLRPLLEAAGAALIAAGTRLGAGDVGVLDDDPARAAALGANRFRGHRSYYRPGRRRCRTAPLPSRVQ